MSGLRRVAPVCRSQWFVPCVALAALAAVDVAAFVKTTPAITPGSGNMSAGRIRGRADRSSAGRDRNVPSPLSPRLEFSTAQLNLGDGQPNEIVRGELTLTNRGDSAAKFSLVRHCGCTELSPLSGKLEPGASETIKVGIQLPGHGNSEKNTSVEIQSGDPAEIVGSCLLSAHCPAPFQVAPAFIGFGSLSANEVQKASHDLYLASIDGQPPLDAERVSVEHDDDVFHVERVGPPDVAGAARPGVVLRITIEPGMPPGDHYDTLTICCSGSQYSMRVPLHVTIAEPITVVPRTVFLRKGEGGGLKGAQLLIVDHRTLPRIGEVSLVDGPHGLIVEDLGALGPGRRRLRLSAIMPTDAWPDESQVSLSADGVMVALKVVKPKSS